MDERNDSVPLPAVLEQHYSELTKFLTQRLGCPTLARELIHDTYIRVRSLKQHPSLENPLAYLYRIVINLARDERRQAGRRAQHLNQDSNMEDLPDARPSIESEIDEHRELRLLQQAVDELPPRCREVFVLRKYHALEQALIAERLGISRSMVEKHLRKGLVYCRQRVKELGGS